MDKKHVFNIGYFLFAFSLLLLFQAWIGYRDYAQVSYSEMIQMAEQGRIASVTLTETRVEGEFKEPQNGKKYFIANRVDPEFAAIFEKAGVKVTGATDSNWLTSLLSWVLPVIVFFVLWSFFFRGMAERQGMGGLINIGKSRAKI